MPILTVFLNVYIYRQIGRKKNETLKRALSQADNSFRISSSSWLSTQLFLVRHVQNFLNRIKKL